MLTFLNQLNNLLVAIKCTIINIFPSIQRLVCPLQLPVLQSESIHPALQVHNPSVCLHVLQLKGQTREQFLP